MHASGIQQKTEKKKGMKHMKTQMKKAGWILLLTVAVLFCSTAAYANGYSIMYDGHFLAFSEAKPQLVNGRAMVPGEEFLKGLGASTAYDAAQEQIMAEKDGVKIILENGQKALTIQKGQAVETVLMETAPCFDAGNGQLYVPANIATDAFGYGVGWDNAAKTVVIIDWDGLLKSVKQDFHIFNMNTGAVIDPEKTIYAKVDGDVTLSAGRELLSAFEMSPGERLQILTNVSYEAWQRANVADLGVNYQFDLSDLEKLLTKENLTNEELAEMKELFDLFSNLEIKIKMDLDQNKLYLNSAVLAALEPDMDADTWYAMSFEDLYGSMGVDATMWKAETWANAQLSMEELFQLYGITEHYTVDTYQNVKMFLDFARQLVGDQAFQKTSANGLDVYTVTIDKLAIAEAIIKTPDLLRQLGDISSFTNDAAVDFRLTLAIQAENDVLRGYDIQYSMDWREEGFSLKGRYQNQMQGSYASTGVLTMDLSVEELGTMRVRMDLESAANGNQRISGRPDVSADKIIDLTEDMI